MNTLLNNQSNFPEKSLKFLLHSFSAKFTELILQFRYDSKNTRIFQSVSQNLNYCNFQLFLKEIYKTSEQIRLIESKDKWILVLEFYFQRKSDCERFLIEKWVFDIGINEQDHISKEKLIGKLTIFLRSLLIILCNTPLFTNYAKNNNCELRKKFLIDHKLTILEEEKFEMKENKEKFRLIESYLELGNFSFIKMRLHFIMDFNEIIEKKIILTEQTKKRDRFFSEGVVRSFENNIKSDISTNDSGLNTSLLMRCDSDNYLKKKSTKIQKLKHESFEITRQMNNSSILEDLSTNSPKPRNLMSRKDSLILLSNTKDKNIKILDDEGEEIEIEYLGNNIKSDFLDIIKEKDETEYHLIEDKILKEHYDEDEELIILSKINSKQTAFKGENILKILQEIKQKIKYQQIQEEISLSENLKELNNFYSNIIKEKN